MPFGTEGEGRGLDEEWDLDRAKTSSKRRARREMASVDISARTGTLLASRSKERRRRVQRQRRQDRIEWRKLESDIR